LGRQTHSSTIVPTYGAGTDIHGRVRLKRGSGEAVRMGSEEAIRAGG